jgi:hypothetical protein
MAGAVAGIVYNLIMQAKPSSPEKKSGGFFSRVSGIFSKKE